MAISKTKNVVAQTKRQIFTTSGTFTVPTNVNSVKVTCIGGGASRGGAGAVAQTIVDTSALQGTGIAVTVGAATSPSTYGNAGASSFGSFVTAGGGFTSDIGSQGSAIGASGTTFISGRSIVAQPTLSTYASSYATLESLTTGVIYNPVGGFYMTAVTAGNASFANQYSYYTSTDGVSWTRRNAVANVASAGNYSSQLNYANGRTFHTYYNASVYYTTSTTNGTTWTNGFNWNATTSWTFATLYDVMYSSTSSTYYFLGTPYSGSGTGPAISASSAANVAAGGQPTINTAPGGTWSLPMTKFLTNGSNIGLVFFLSSPQLQYSLFNGSTWAVLNTSPIGTFTNYPTSGAWDGTKFTVTLLDGTIHTSTNGTTWTATGTTVSGLSIQGHTGSYYYGSLNGQLAYSSNGTTWTAIHWIYPGTLGVTATKFISVVASGLLGTFDITSPNTTIAAGYAGVITSGVYLGGGAGSSPRLIGTGSVNDADGVDGYGRSMINQSFPPSTYGSTNGLAAQQGAVILEWLQ